jgi:hypothetical protein
MERTWNEAALDAAASAILGMAVAFACTLLGAGGAGAVAGAGAFALTFLALSRVPSAGVWRLAAFDVAAVPSEADFQCDEGAELILTDADRLDVAADLHAVGHAVGDELLLEDALDTPGPQSRVVQLFGDRALPTAGELQATIARHLERRSSPAHDPDASAALSDALAELRRSLR